MRGLTRFFRNLLSDFLTIPQQLLSRFRFLDRFLKAVLPWNFLSAWFGSRPYRQLLMGLPAMFGLTALLASATYALFPSKPPDLSYYTESAYAARQNGDDDVADLFLKKAATVKTGSMRERYNQAQLLIDAEQHEQARDIIDELVTEGAGYVPARIFVINECALELKELSKVQRPGPENINRRLELVENIEFQSKGILDVEPNHPFAMDALVKLSIARGDRDAALSYLDRLSSIRPETNLLKAELLRADGDEESAVRTAKLAESFFEKKLLDEQLTNEQRSLLRMQLASSLVIQEDFSDAAKTLLDGGKPASNPALRSALGEVYFVWSESIVASADVSEPNNATQLARKLELLDAALKLKPNDPRVLKRIAMIAGTRGEAGDKARAAMRELLAEGNASGLVHFVLGVSAMMNGDTQESLKHMELANRQSPQTPVTLNNLAFLIAKSEKPDLPRALELINRAIELRADVPEFYDTRGGIYFLMRRYSEAVTDLEKALRGGAGNRLVLHQSLAKAYSELKMEDLSEIHQKKAATLEVEKKKQ